MTREDSDKYLLRMNLQEGEFLGPVRSARFWLKFHRQEIVLVT